MASLIGKEIGKYRITERIGRGGMADVYLGIHTHLDRKVAVKVLHSHLLEGGDFVARFKREAKAVANLRHPNIVQVYDFDVQDDMIFMVMEYIDGASLHSRLVEVGNRGERMPIKLIGSIINDIAGALDYAHSKNMLHRDIKPSNILLDKNDKAYLTDFGIAKLLDDQKFTATGQLIGTPAYMSPEQGMGEDLTEESDIYSLGIVAFEMLTGQVPYDAKTPIGIVHKQINDPVPDLSQLVDGVPGTAQEVLNRALAKTPEGRFNRAEDLVKALRVALQALDSTEPIVKKAAAQVEEILDAPTVTMDADDLDQPTVVMEEQKPAAEAKPEKAAPPTPPAGEKKKIPLWGYVAGGVALLVVLGVILTQVFDPGWGAGSVPAGAVSASVHAAEGMDGINIYAVPDGDFEYVTIDKKAAWMTGSGEVFEAADGNQDQDFFIYFAVDDDRIFDLPPGEEVYIEVVYLDQGTDQFRLQYDSHDPNWPADGGFTDTSPVTKTDSGEFLTARFVLADPLFINRNGGGDFRLDDSSDGPEVIRSVTVVYLPEGIDQIAENVGEGEDLYNEANAAYENGDDPLAIDLCNQAIDAGFATADVYNLIGRAHRRMGEYDPALEAYDQAIELDPDHFWAHYNRGRIRLDQGDPWAAIDDLTIATELDENSYHAWTYLGTAYFYTGDEDKMGLAHEALDRAIDLAPDYYQARLSRGELRWFHFRSEDALEDFNIAVDNAPGGEYRPFSSRGIFFLETGQFQGCVDDLTVYIERFPDDAWGFFQRGQCFQLLGEVDPARADYETFLEMSEGNPDFNDLRGQVEAWLESN